jgi:hypothetical protein
MTPQNRGKTGASEAGRKLAESGKAFRFKKGQPSANPGGRPKKKPITEIYEELLAEGVTRDAIKKTMRALVRKKNGLAVQALREMADRIEGRAQGNENVHVSGLENLAEEIAEGRKRASFKAD